MIAIKVDSKNHCNNYSIITLYNKLTELFLQWTFFACGKNWCVMAITRCFGYAYVKTLCTNCEVAQSGLWPRTVICLTARFFSHTFWSPFHPFWTIFLRNNWCVMAVASAWCGSYEYSISWLNTEQFNSMFRYDEPTRFFDEVTDGVFFFLCILQLQMLRYVSLTDRFVHLVPLRVIWLGFS